jgi:GAF domain-containing protein
MNKYQFYSGLTATVRSVFDSGQNLSLTSKLMLISSMLYNSNKDWVFCGFYMAINNRILEIGPYQSKILPCTHISYGKGICGESAIKKIPIIVDNVKEYPNYISCDSETKSEIVIPLIKNGNFLGVLDIDSQKVADFDNNDLKYLSNIIELI